MRSLAVGAILVGIGSVVAALTLLPALLGLIGDRVDRLRIPLVGSRSLKAANPEGRFWGAIVRGVLRRPALALAASAAVLLPGMLARGRGGVINVASQMAFTLLRCSRPM